jgi:hypothetical protein
MLLPKPVPLHLWLSLTLPVLPLSFAVIPP